MAVETSPVLPALHTGRVVLVHRVERFFGELPKDVIREGSFTSMQGLVSDIESCLIERNRNPKPCR